MTYIQERRDEIYLQRMRRFIRKERKRFIWENEFEWDSLWENAVSFDLNKENFNFVPSIEIFDIFILIFTVENETTKIFILIVRTLEKSTFHKRSSKNLFFLVEI